MTHHFSSQVIPMDKHVIHIFFKSVGSSLSGWKREVVCNIGSICAFALLFLAEFFISYIFTRDDPGRIPLNQSVLFMLSGAILLGVTTRLATVLFNRLPTPFDWLISPMPLLLSGFTWLYFYVYSMNLHRAMHDKYFQVNPISGGPFDIVWPLVCILFTLILFSNYYRASKIKQKEIQATEGVLA